MATVATESPPAAAPGFEGVAPIPRDQLGRLLLVAFAFYLVLASVYQTLTLTAVTDDVIRKGIEAIPTR